MVAVAAIESGFSRLGSTSGKSTLAFSTDRTDNKLQHRYSGFLGSDSGGNSQVRRWALVALEIEVGCSKRAIGDLTVACRRSGRGKAAGVSDCYSTFAFAGRDAPEQRSDKAGLHDAALKVHVSAPTRFNGTVAVGHE
jgi:hypothetical protein